MPAHPAAPLWACCCPAPPGPHSAGLLSRHSSPNLCLSLDYLTSSCVGFTRQSVGSRVGCCWGGLCGCQLHFKANVEDFISASKQIDKDIHSVLDWVVSLWSFKQHHQSGREQDTVFLQWQTSQRQQCSVQLSISEYREVSMTGRGACEMSALLLQGNSLGIVMLLFLYCWKVEDLIVWFVQGRFLDRTGSVSQQFFTLHLSFQN